MLPRGARSRRETLENHLRLPERLSPDRLRWRLPHRTFATPPLDPLAQVLPAQASGRALLRREVLDPSGAHLFLTGLSGPERRQQVLAALRCIAPPNRDRRDLVWVPDPVMPQRLLLRRLAAGQGRSYCAPRPSGGAPHLFHQGERGLVAPIVLAADPTPSLLAGSLDPGATALQRSPRAGLLHDAHGGFLILDADDLERQPASLRLLRLLLAEGGLRPGVAEERPALLAEVVPLDVRLVIVCANGSTAASWLSDADLSALVRNPVSFDPRPELDPQVGGELRAWIEERGRQAGWPALLEEAFALAIEHLVREGGRGGRVPMDLPLLESLVAQAARRSQGQDIDAPTMAAVIGEWKACRAWSGTWTRRSMLEGFLQIPSEGTAIGEVNGLAVYRGTGQTFARPIRVSASVGSGKGGLVDVEREVGLSGPSHQKGVRLLTGFLRTRFSRRRTLAIQASLAVEQHYGRIDGDSASLAELCALLSALANEPLRQDIALTGAVDQRGRVLSVGSVTLKVEGFFRLCEARGLSGQQGVVLPLASVGDLCLEEDIVTACAQGRFHLWSVGTVEEALSLLCAREVGDPQAETWPEDSLYGRIDAELLAFEAVQREASRGPAARR